TPEGSADVNFPLNGRHNILNALAAAAVGHSFAMTPKSIASALSAVAPPPQRGEVMHFAAGFTVINDSYNSNPDALPCMVEARVGGSNDGSRRIVVAGEMLELGPNEREIHRDVGRMIAASGVNRLVGVRGLASEMVDAASIAGLKNAEFA